MAIRKGNTEGTFSGTGSSDGIKCRVADVSLNFAGTATVNVQRSFDGGSTYRTIDSFTGSAEKTYEAGATCFMRVNCSAHTDDVDYVVKSQGEF
jgi:hypothetical protein